MQVQFCWDLVFLSQLVEDSIHGLEQENYSRGLIYSLELVSLNCGN